MLWSQLRKNYHDIQSIRNAEIILMVEIRTTNEQDHPLLTILLHTLEQYKKQSLPVQNNTLFKPFPTPTSIFLRHLWRHKTDGKQKKLDFFCLGRFNLFHKEGGICVCCTFFFVLKMNGLVCCFIGWKLQHREVDWVVKKCFFEYWISHFQPIKKFRQLTRLLKGFLERKMRS